MIIYISFLHHQKLVCQTGVFRCWPFINNLYPYDLHKSNHQGIRYRVIIGRDFFFFNALYGGKYVHFQIFYRVFFYLLI